MTEQEVQAVEQVIDDIAQTITALVGEKTEIEERISELGKAKAALIRLLPHEKRIDRLFS